MMDRGIVLKQFGDYYKAICPFHQEKTPSCSVNPAKGVYYCFGCGAKGDSIQFVMQYDNLSFAEAVLELAKSAGITLTQATPKQPHPAFEVLNQASLYYQQSLAHQPTHLQYLEDRQISQQLIEHFGLGSAPDEWDSLTRLFISQGVNTQLLQNVGLTKISQKNNTNYDTFRNRIMFPIRDERGRCLGFGARAIAPDQQPKYLNSPETNYYRKSQILYGVYEASLRQREMILVEGYLDVIRMHHHGFSNTVATCGTALTAQHIQKLKRITQKLTLLLDGDEAGHRAALKCCAMLLESGMEASVACLPPSEDPDSFLQKHGADAMTQILKSKRPLFQYLVHETFNQPQHDVQGKVQAVDSLIQVAHTVKRRDLREIMLTSIAETAGLPLQTILQNFQKSKTTHAFNQQPLNQTPTLPDEDEQIILATMLECYHTLATQKISNPTGKQTHNNTNECLQIIEYSLEPDEFQSLLAKDIYLLLQKKKENLNEKESVEDFEDFTKWTNDPNLLNTFNMLWIKRPSSARLNDVKLIIRRIKEQAIRRNFAQKRQEIPDDIEKMRLSREERMELAELADLFPIGKTTRSKIVR